jgi:diapolycopene oxygenase
MRIKSIVIGAGIAGLASAIRLSKQGYKAIVCEASGKVGGKIAERNFNNFRFDAGPSLLTLPELVHDLLDEDLKFNIKRLDVIAKYFYEDGTEIMAYNDVTKLSEEIEKKIQVPSSRVVNYLNHASIVYSLTSDLFIFGSFHRISKLLNFKALKTVLNVRQLKAFSSLHDFNKRKLGDKRLVQLFDRYATYNGSNPYQTPATLSVISHLEHNLGAFIPEEGMFQVIDSLYKQAVRLGVEFRFNTAVQKLVVEKGKVQGVFLDSGFEAADIVISDVDIHHFYSSIFPDIKRLSKIQKEEPSTSALIFYWGMNCTFPQLDIHNILFNADYENEFKHLFELNDFCSDPTVYIYISSKYNSTDAPENCENWFVMINAPADLGQNWDGLVMNSRINIINKLNRKFGINIENHIVCEQILTPPDIAKQTGSVYGSLYGNSSNSRYASFNRHANFRTDIEGIYFVGGSVHPGGGIPLCLSSAKIVEDLLMEKIKKQKR